ncbi:MAG: hypothetical protein V4510_01425 [bacterium]
MAFDWVAAVRLVHILGAVLWLGAGVFMLTMIMPAVKDAGMAGKGFMMTVVRRGGFGKYYGPVAGITIVAGLTLYFKEEIYKTPFGSNSLGMITVGMVLAILAFLDGIAVILPTEAKLKKLVAQVGAGGPSPEQAAKFEALAMKIGRSSVLGITLVGITFLLMTGRAVFT